MIGTGSRVKVRESDYDPASGITGVVDMVDASQVPFHVKFDTPRHGVVSSWFEAKVLVELGGSKRTADELETLIEGFNYVYNPIDDTDYQAGTRRWEAYANRIEAGGEVNDECTAYFGYEDELLDMEQDQLVELIETEVMRANLRYREDKNRSKAMAVYGLPTFPIAHGMVLGNREPEEIAWLLDHGVIQSDIYSYKKIIKISETEYRLVQCKDSRYSEHEETLSGATTLQTLVEMEHLKIAYWYWYGKSE